MRPYAKSGTKAQERLGVYDPRPDQRRECYLHLRSLQRRINVLGVAGILSIVGVGMVTMSGGIALAIGLVYLAGICLLEICERRVKRRLAHLK